MRYGHISLWSLVGFTFDPGAGVFKHYMEYFFRASSQR
jgi:hypothetical protein